MSLLLAAQRALTVPGWAKDELSRKAQATPSLDLRFADNKSLVDATTGQNLVSFTRASSGTYVDSQGVIKTATTNEARFDHNPTTGESLGLLVEEGRTNLLVQSNGFDTTWINSNSSETAAAEIAPDGTNTAWELKDSLDASPTAHSLQQTITSFTSGTTYTFSVWMKAGTLSEGGIALPSAAFGSVLINRINLATGAVITSTASLTSSVVFFPNGWRRIIASATATATAAGSVQIRPMNGGTTYTGTGTGTVLIWGAQLEAGAFPTSYIPTTTATATRSADVASISGSNFSSWYRQDEGTVFAEIDRSVAITSASTAVSINDNSLNNRLFNFRQDSASQLTVLSVTGGGVDGSPQVSLISTSAKNKIAAAQATNNLAVSANGGALLADTSVAMPTVNQMQIGNVNNTSVYNGTIRRLTYWPQRLPNSTLQAITQ